MVLIETWCAWFTSVPTTIIVTLFIISIFKVICDAKEDEELNYSNPDNIITIKKGNKIFTYCGTICLTTFWFRSTIQSIVFTVLIAQDRHLEHIGTSLDMSWLFYGSGLWLMLVSFVLRIQYTFKGTHLQYSPVIIKILYFLLALLIIEIILIVIFNTFPTYYEQLIVAYITLVSHFLFSVLLTYLLFSKIFVTMQYRLRERLGTNVIAVRLDVDPVTGGQEMTRMDDDDDNKENVDEAAGMNQISLSSIKSVTRYALLMFIGIISTYIVSILIFIDIEYGWSVSDHMLTWGSALVGLDLLVNATAVYLLFQHNSNKYYKVCKICHIGCERFCVEIIYLYSKKSKRNGMNSSAKNREEFATLILTPDDDTVVI